MAYLTVPSQVGQSLEGSGTERLMAAGRCTNSARFSKMASATQSAVALSPLQQNAHKSKKPINQVQLLN